MKQYHLGIDQGDVAPYVLLPGDPGRVPVVASSWDEARHVATNREYVTYTGTLGGVPITCTSTGIGAPSTAIAMEELARCGATTFIRIGTAGGYQARVRTGDMVVFEGAVRLDGTSKLYVPPEYPAVASHEVVAAAVETADRLAIPYHVGLTRSSDALYAGRPQPGSSFGGYWDSRWASFDADLARQGVLAGEMESSVVFVLARLWGLRAGSVALVVVSTIRPPEETRAVDPSRDFDAASEGVERLSRFGNEIVRTLARHDAARQGARTGAGG